MSKPNIIITIGTLDRVLSELLLLSGSGDLDEADKQTMKHHAEDMEGAAKKIMKDLGFHRDYSQVAEPLILNCPKCGKRHVDKDEWLTRLHHQHLCEYCQYVWEPWAHYTVGLSEVTYRVGDRWLDPEGRSWFTESVGFFNKQILITLKGFGQRRTPYDLFKLKWTHAPLDPG